MGFSEPLLRTIGEPSATFRPAECCSRSSRLDFSCSDIKSLVERAREGDVGVVGVREGGGTEGEGKRNACEGDGVPMCEDGCECGGVSVCVTGCDLYG